MIKKLQALRAKKGFTLVELIVVIAIIGVLAAILIPTLTSQITKAKVTSADSTAKEILGTVNVWITDCVVAGGSAPTTVTDIDLSSTTLTGPTGVESLADRLKNDYPGAKMFGHVYLENGKAFACCYSDNSAPGTWPTAAEFKSGTKAWPGDEGVESSGIIGTSPKLKKGTTSSSSST